MLDKVKGYAVDLVAATVAVESTTGIKDIAPRSRPNDSGKDSFPSGHATTSSSYTRLATLRAKVVFAALPRGGGELTWQLRFN